MMCYVIITDGNNGQNFENKTQIDINLNNLLSILRENHPFVRSLYFLLHDAYSELPWSEQGFPLLQS